MSLTRNPYFDPNPVWMFIILKIWCFISIIFTIIGCYVVLYYSPKQKSKTFCYLLIYHLFVAMFFELTLTVLTPPLVLLPFVAIETPGLMTSLGLPMAYQLIQLFTSAIATVAAVCPLFYYRMDLLLPTNHFFNKKIFRYLMYFFVYGVCYILFAPLLYLAINYEDQNRVKKALEVEYRMTFDHLWSPFVVAANFDDNPFALLVAIVVLLLCVACVALFIICSTVIYHTVKSKTSNLSINTKKHHIVLLKSLITMIAVLGFQVMVVIPVLLSLVSTHSQRADIANIFVSIAGGAYPSAVLVYTLNYPPYRLFYVEIYHLLRRIMLRKQVVVPVMHKKLAREGTAFSVHSKL